MKVYHQIPNMLLCPSILFFFSNFSLSQRLSGPGQTAEFVAQEKRLQWKIKKIFGKSEVTAVFKVCVLNFFSFSNGFPRYIFIT